MKKFFCAAAAVAAGLISAVAFAGCEVGEAEITYKLSEDGTHYVVSGYTGDDRALTSLSVPATYAAEGGDELPVTEIGENAFRRCAYLTKVDLGVVEKIGDLAFSYCGLTELTIPATVTHIGFGAFAVCDNLTSVSIPDTVTVLEDKAFFSCENLEKAYVKANISVLSDGVFGVVINSGGGNTYVASSLKEIYLGASITKINVTALQGTPLTDLYFAGSAEKWEEVYFFELVTEKDDKGESVVKENKLDKKKVMGNVNLHLNAQF